MALAGCDLKGLKGLGARLRAFIHPRRFGTLASRLIAGSVIMTTAKDAAKEILETLPDDATWEDLMYELYVKKKIETGLNDVREGRTVSHEDVKKRFLAHED